jgi:lysophospholipase L1-like esterase
MKIRSEFCIALLCLCCSSWAQQALPFFHTNDVIVFQGDSITDGGRQRTGSDYNHIMGQDYAYILAAQVGLEYPDRNLTFLNRGIGSEQIVNLAARWQTDVLDLKPNVLSILIGVNDTLMTGDKSESVEQYESTYDVLLAKTIETLPGIKIILGEPFLLPVGRHKESYGSEMIEIKKRQVVVHRLGIKFHLPVVRLQDTFDQACVGTPADHWSWDGVHPTYAGHALIAQEWLKAASAFWPKG